MSVYDEYTCSSPTGVSSKMLNRAMFPLSWKYGAKSDSPEKIKIYIYTLYAWYGTMTTERNIQKI